MSVIWVPMTTGEEGKARKRKRMNVQREEVKSNMTESLSSTPPWKLDSGGNRGGTEAMAITADLFLGDIRTHEIYLYGS